MQIKPTWLSLGSHQLSWSFWPLVSSGLSLCSLTSIMSGLLHKWSFYINYFPQTHSLFKMRKLRCVDITKLTKGTMVSGYLSWNWNPCDPKIPECHSNPVGPLSLNPFLCNSFYTFKKNNYNNKNSSTMAIIKEKSWW